MRFKRVLLAAAVGAAVSSPAFSASVDLGGYFRAGGGSSSEGGKEICFRLPGARVWFRLGNECDTYVALTLNSELGKVDGTTFKAHFTTAQGTQTLTNWEQSLPSLREAYVEAVDFGAAMGMPGLKGSTLWVGKRYTFNEDFHMLDYSYLDAFWGTGAGINNVDLGFAKFSYSYLRTGEQDWSGAGGFTPNIVDGGAATVTTHDFRLRGIATNPGGSLGLTLDLVQANNRAVVAGGPDKPGKNGWSTTVTHEQSDLFGLGGGNKVMFQYYNGATGFQLAPQVAFTGDNRKGWMLADHWHVEPKSMPVSMTATIGMFDEKQGSGALESRTKSFWIGARPHYHLNNIWSLMSEVGYQSVKPSLGGVNGDTIKLTKVTLGTQFAMGKSVWSRPALRFYTTFAKWNDAAKGRIVCTGRDCNTPVPAFNDKTSGVSYGVQVESWF